MQSKVLNFVSAYTIFFTGHSLICMWQSSISAVYWTLIKRYNQVLYGTFCFSNFLIRICVSTGNNGKKKSLALIRRHVFGPSQNSVLKQQGHVHCLQLCWTKQKIINCHKFIPIWKLEPFSGHDLASVVVVGLGGQSGSTLSSWARCMYRALGILLWGQQSRAKHL